MRTEIAVGKKTRIDPLGLEKCFFYEKALGIMWVININCKVEWFQSYGGSFHLVWIQTGEMTNDRLFIDLLQGGRIFFSLSLFLLSRFVKSSLCSYRILLPVHIPMQLGRSYLLD